MNFKPSSLLTIAAVFLCSQLPNLFCQESSEKLIIAKNPPKEVPQQTLDSYLLEYEGNYVSRPSHHTGAFESLIVDFKVDGYNGQHMALKGPVISLKGSVPRDWQQDPALSSRFGIALRNRYVPEIVMSFTVFKRSNFLPDANPENVIAYLAGLKNIYRDRLLLNEMTRNFKQEGFMSHLLGNETLHVDYTIKSRIEDTSGTRHYTYLVLMGDNWVEITLFGPDDKLANFIEPFQRFLRNLSIVQNETEAFGQNP